LIVDFFTFIVGWAVSLPVIQHATNVRQGWDKDVLLFKWWRSCCQLPPAIATLGDGLLLHPLLSRSSSATTSSYPTAAPS
jgi:hypothetical protein